MAVEVKYLSCRDRVELEIARLGDVLARRGIFYEDEGARHQAMRDVLGWMVEDKYEADRIELEAMEAEEAAKEAARLADPNRQTKELFGTYRDKLKREGKMR